MLASGLSISISLVALYYIAGIFLDPFLQYCSAGGIILLMIAIHNLEGRFGLRFRVFFLSVAGFVTLRYWVFRTFDTLAWGPPIDMVFMLLLYAAETYGIIIHYIGMVVNVHHMRRTPVPLPEDQSLWPVVDVFIPTYDEPVEVVRVTAAAATMLAYPREKLNIYLLDDGGTLSKLSQPDMLKAAQALDRAEAIRAVAREMGVHYITRAGNAKAKAGNINAALELTADLAGAAGSPVLERCLLAGECPGPGELILILDTDHVPTRDFLANTVGFFLKDPNLYVLQTPHFFINPTPAEKNLSLGQEGPGENDMFYGAVHLGLDFWNASFFCGSAAVLRRSFLLETGGLAGESITEDCEVSLHQHARGHNSAYLLKPMVCGFSPETFADFILQRLRWAKGMTQILVLNNPLRAKGLDWGQRLCYFNSVFYWFFGLARIMYFLGPLLYLFFGMKIYMAQVSMFVIFGFPHLVASYLVTNYLFGTVRQPFFSELYEFIQSIYLLPAVCSVVRNPRKPTFKVTPKGQTLEKEFFSTLGLPFWAMAVMCLLAYPAGAVRWSLYPLEHGTILLTLAWSTFNLVIVMLCLGAVWEKRQIRKHHRFRTSGEVSVGLAALAEPVRGSIQDLSLSGAGVALPGVLALKADDLVRVTARDSLGNLFELDARVTRVQHRGGATLAGLLFQIGDTASFKAAVGFVYGDSSRWEEIMTARSSARGNILLGLYRLLAKSVDGLLNTSRGLVLAGYEYTSDWLARRTIRTVETHNEPYVPVVDNGPVLDVLRPAEDIAGQAQGFGTASDLGGLRADPAASLGPAGES